MIEPTIQQVTTLLEVYDKKITGNEPRGENGLVDWDAFQAMPETVAVIETLKDIGVSRDWLKSNGFKVYALILEF